MYYIRMAKSISVIQKKRGRPATGHDPVMAIRLPPDLTERIDEWMKASNAQSRSDAIRQLIELGLDTSASKTRKSKKPRQRRSPDKG
jgi:Arc/MetJ-type ribon-helix-helix transcriptional regulator